MREETRETGLQFDKRFWICHHCKAVCVDYPTLKDHQATPCKVLTRARRKAHVKHAIMTETEYEIALEEGQRVLEEWGFER